MASSDHLTRLKNIRDNLEKELENETARRTALTVAGHPPPATYNSGGKSVSWTEYMSTMLGKVAEVNALIVAAGADGGLYEERIRGYS